MDNNGLIDAARKITTEQADNKGMRKVALPEYIQTQLDSLRFDPDFKIETIADPFAPSSMKHSIDLLAPQRPRKVEPGLSRRIRAAMAHDKQ